jgi:hypothetical protein
MADTRLLLGPIAFQGFEIPERINFGGKQTHHIHKLIGGQRVIDAMGQDPDEIQWKGRFRGAGALTRARAVDALRASGAEVTLSWGGLFFFVIVSHFSAEYERFYEIPYEIECCVSLDPLNAILGTAVSTVTSLINGDVTSMLSIGALL